MSKRVFLVTGASAGIGLALSKRLGEAGNTVYAAARRADLISQTPGLIPVQLDVNRSKDAAEVVSRIEREAGRLDVLVNNAGYGLYGAFEELTDEEFRAQMETNFFAAANLMRAALPGMRRRKSGTIANVTSILGRMTIPTGSAYTSSKYALEALSEAVRAETAPFGITVCAIEPGLIRTSFKDAMVKSARITDSSSPYAFLNRLVQTDYTSFSTSPEACAARIMRILMKKRPARRYRVGLDAHFYNALIHFLPDGILDVLVRMYVRNQFKKEPQT
jgi:NAD(P)-dependent dehydrogenase (short-subunit alcohol dehydrogenase family)